MTIGFIGQGFIGKNYADDFERRGYSVIRYALEAPYNSNKEKIALCDIVFIAVPTPTTPAGFQAGILESVLPLVGKGKTAVIKSTTPPGTVRALQEKYPELLLLHSPEFLVEKTAAYDAANPKRNIIGMSRRSSEQEARAREVLALLPKAPYELIADSTETELIKYANNLFLYMKVLYANMLYDLSTTLGINYQVVQAAVAEDPRIGPSHLRVVDSSGHPNAKSGRGAGGHCLIKDVAALRMFLEKNRPADEHAISILRSLEAKNIELLKTSGKDLDLLGEVYG